MRLVPELGVVAPELNWVPSPSYALRRAAVLERVKRWAPGRVLELGCGSGALLYELAARGFSGVGVESSAAARAIATELLREQPGVRVADALPADPETFDYLLSFEVLEHIERDAEALTSWVRRLERGGSCLLSVPAHRSRWNLTDVLAGHYRRYDRADVARLVERAGLVIQRIETIGFPATWVIERARLLARWADVRSRGIDPATLPRGDSARTHASGVDRALELKLFPLYGSRMGRRCLRWAAHAQEAFADTDWGISYLVTAARP